MKRAFSLIEVAAAIAIAGIVTAAALSSTVMLHRSFVTNRKRVAQSDDVRITVEHVLSRVRNAGGGPLRPWQAVSVSCEDDPVHPLPPCGPRRGRLHVVQVEPRIAGSITSVDGNEVIVATAGGNCPLPAGLFPIVYAPAERHLAALGGAAWRTGVCAPLPGGCGCIVVPATDAVGFSVPGTTTSPLTDAMFTDGVIVGGRVSTYFVDDATKTLRVLTDLRKVGVAETTSLMPTAAAFEARLGYDVDGDGVLETPLRTDQHPTSPQALRSVRVGLALSTVAADQATRAAPWLDGELRVPGQMILSLEGTALVRANGLFQ